MTTRLLISMAFQVGHDSFSVSGHCRRKGRKGLVVQHEQVSRPIPIVTGAGKVEAALAVASRYSVSVCTCMWVWVWVWMGEMGGW